MTNLSHRRQMLRAYHKQSIEEKRNRWKNRRQLTSNLNKNYLVKACGRLGGYIMVGRLYVSNQYVGKRIILKIEEVSICNQCGGINETETVKIIFGYPSKFDTDTKHFCSDKCVKEWIKKNIK